MDTLQQLSYEDKVTRQIELADAGFRKAAQDLARVEARDAAAQALIPQVVDTLINTGIVNPERREKIANVLVDHRETLRLLDLVAKRQSASPRLGHAVAEGPAKQAASAVGRTDEATRRLFQGLRLPVPE